MFLVMHRGQLKDGVGKKHHSLMDFGPDRQSWQRWRGREMSSISSQTWQRPHSFETRDKAKTNRVMENNGQGRLDIYVESKIRDESSRGSGPTSAGSCCPNSC